MAGLLAVLESDGDGAQLPLTLPVATAADMPAPTPADTDARPQRQMRVSDAEAGEAPASAPVFPSCANGNDPRPGEIVGTAAAQSPEHMGDGHLPTPAPPPRGSDAAGDELRAKALEIVNANVNATLDYARELAQVRSPTEFIALSTSHARRRFELMMTHATALGALSHPFAVRWPDE
jgi:hypothetical protein